MGFLLFVMYVEFVLNKAIRRRARFLCVVVNTWYCPCFDVNTYASLFLSSKNCVRIKLNVFSRSKVKTKDKLNYPARDYLHFRMSANVISNGHNLSPNFVKFLTYLYRKNHWKETFQGGLIVYFIPRDQNWDFLIQGQVNLPMIKMPLLSRVMH